MIPSSVLKTEGVLSGRPLSAIATFMSECVDLIVAAARVSQAVEARRQPAASDLKTLGITQRLPTTW